VKILVISSNLIGDTILSTGVIEHFSKNNVGAKFTFLIGPTAGQIYEHFPSLDKIISIKKKRYNLHWFKMYFNCWITTWDIVIDLRSSLLSYLLFTKKRYIFKKNKTLHHIDQLNQFFNIRKSNLLIHTSNEEKNIVRKKIDNNFHYVVIFPGGNWKPKIWSVQLYNKLLHLINNKFSNIKFILVGSTYERKLYTKVLKENLSNDSFINLMGESLTLTSAFMKKSSLFIGNDSGLMHMSVASKLSTIGLFGPTDDKLYGHKENNCFIIRTKEEYLYFSKNNENIDSNKSYMFSIKPEQILDVIIDNNLL